jgi:transcriptional regulator with XRE-family HTH domain
MTKPKTKRPNPIEVYVGSRVRMRRLMLNLSQEKLGKALGITVCADGLASTSGNIVTQIQLDSSRADSAVRVRYAQPRSQSPTRYLARIIFCSVVLKSPFKRVR